MVENPIGVSFEPGIGAVLARASREVTPRQTTTYVLTVHGPRDHTQEVTVTIPGTAPLKAVTPVGNPQNAGREAEPLRSL